MNVTQTRKQRERAARESLVLEHAARLLVRDGFQELNLDELAGAVEYSKGTLYLHFKSKEDLALAVATQAVKYRAELLERGAAFAGTSRERVRAMAFACGEFMMSHRDFFAVELMLQERSFWERVSEERRSQHLVEIERVFKVVDQVVLEARGCGDLPRRHSPAEVALSLTTVAMGSQCMATLPGFQTVSQIKDPAASLLICAERMMDGWGWKPISDGSRGDALDRRIHRQVFPESTLFKTSNEADDERPKNYNDGDGKPQSAGGGRAG